MKPKKKFDVYRVSTQYYEGGQVATSKRFLGSTYAVSAAQAESNMRYRMGLKPADLYASGMYDYERVDEIVAEEAEP